MSSFNWSVVNAQPRDDFTILIEFFDGKVGVYDAKPLLDWGVYAPLRHRPFFMKAHAANGTVVWDDQIDIAPERLYEESTPLTSA